MNNKKYLFGLIFSLAVIAYVLANVDWEAALHTFSQLNWGWLAVAFGVYCLNYVLRTLRFKSLLNLDSISFIQLLGVTNLYGMYLYLMPAKSGELSYPILLKNKLDVALPSSTATLIAARLFDFATIALFLPPVLFVFWAQMPPWMRVSALIFSGLVILLGCVGVWMVRRSPGIINSPKIRINNSPLKRLKRFIHRLIESLHKIDKQKQYWRIWFITVGIWLCVQTNFYLITLSLGYNLSFFQIVVVSLIMVPMTLLPLQGFANLGTHEIGWVTAFSLFEKSRAISLNIAVSSHILLLLFVLLLGLIGFLLLQNNARGGNGPAGQ